MTNIVVQIGLNGRLELDYLALPRFRVISEALESACHKYVVPKFILDAIGIGEQLHVVGVEMHPVQIERLKAQYKDIRNIHFLHRVLHSENAKAFPHFSYCIGDHRNNKEGEKYVSPAVTIETLFDEILALEGLEKVGFSGFG